MTSLLAPAVAILVLGASPAEKESRAAWLVRRATWTESMLESREALFQEEAKTAAASGASLPPRLHPWYGLGPISNLDRAAELESRLLAEKSPQLDAAFPIAPDLPPVGWVARFDLKEGSIHRLHSGEHVLYLRRGMTAPAAMTFDLHLDVMGEMTVWLNGGQMLAKRSGKIRHDIWGGDPQLAPTAVRLPLRAGENDLLVKIELHPQPRPADDENPWKKATFEARRPWGAVFNGYATRSGPAVEYEKLVYHEVSNLYCSTAPPAGPLAGAATKNRERIWSFLVREFSDPQSRAEMQRERHEGLWEWDWAAGDLCELATRYANAIPQAGRAAECRQRAALVTDRDGLWSIREAYHHAKTLELGEACTSNEDARKTLQHRLESLRLAIADLSKTHGPAYARGAEFANRLVELEGSARKAQSEGNAALFADVINRLETLQREALLANPLLDFERLLLVKRRANLHVPDLPLNWANNSSLPTDQYDNEIAVLTRVDSAYQMATLFKPDGGKYVGDLDLHFAGDRLLFSMPGSHNRWQVFELRTDGGGLRQVTRGDQEDVDQFDACYLPNGKIIFCSTAMFAGVPCVQGRDFVGALYVMDHDGSQVRQLCFDQDQDYCPTVLNDGRVLYTRWEYADVPHFFSRLLFTMNPDGTGQTAYYGSNSYWPNGVFYAQPIPGSPTQVVGIVSGHHAARRSGELVLFDPARGSQETQGVVQRIPGRGEQVEPVINDRLVVGSWPKFLHPSPLSDKYFLVSGKMNETSRWGIYLVDVFDNMLLLCEDENHDLLEPIPWRARPRPPVIPDRVDRRQRDGIVSLANVYAGPGLAGVPPGTIERLRVIAYHYAYRGMADDSRAIGVDSSWDTVKVVLGTVPVHKDGSAHFRVPANTPITIQPLDSRGRAVQLMRSWMTVMPGETQSCVGCHASGASTPPASSPLAAQREPAVLEPWYGPPRGFSFQREVQPVLDRYCTTCHHGRPLDDGRVIADLTERPSSDPRRFSPSYLELQRFVRRPGAETDYHLLPAGEYHASVSELVQLLEKGHHNVQLDEEAWDRLFTWIDLNAPYHGSWREAQGAERLAGHQVRRQALRRLYAGLDDDPEEVGPAPQAPAKPITPEPVKAEPAAVIQVSGWPFDAQEAQRRQEAERVPIARTIVLGDGVSLRLARIPAGEFVFGDPQGLADERPQRKRIEQPFWIGVVEVTNEQFARFDPAHDSRYIQTHGISSTRGYPINLPEQPAARVSWNQATAFCRWLSKKTGETFTLPTEEMWEYACRTGSETPFSFGAVDADFSAFANLADRQVEHFRDYSHNSPVGWIPREQRCDDGAMATAPVGRYRPNAWGLYDMHGNVAEWTSSVATTSEEDNAGAPDNLPMVVRGGSWLDRPHRSRAAFRLAYARWQKVFNVGFRVVCLAEPTALKADQPEPQSPGSSFP